MIGRQDVTAMKQKMRHTAHFALIFFAIAHWDLAHAYIGPGAGLGVIGTVIAFVGTILLAIVGFIWYPVKRVMRKRRKANEQLREQAGQEPESSQQQGAQG